MKSSVGGMNLLRIVAILLLLIAALLLVALAVLGPLSTLPRSAAPSGSVWSFRQVVRAAQQGQIEEVTVTDGDELIITLTNGEVVTSVKDPSSSIQAQLADLGVSSEQLAAIEWKQTSTLPGGRTLIPVLIGLLVVNVVGGLALLIVSFTQREGPHSRRG